MKRFDFDILRRTSILLILGSCCLIVFSGCETLQGRKKPRIEEVPPYYTEDSAASYYGHASERERMIEEARVFRNSEFQKLEREIVEQEKDKKWEADVKATQEKREKAKFWKWFGSGDKTFMMSEEAKRINANLER